MPLIIRSSTNTRNPNQQFGKIRKRQHLRKPRISRRLFLGWLTITAGSAIGLSIHDRNREIEALTKFFAARQGRMQNFSEPENHNPEHWAEAVYEHGWTAQELEAVDQLAAKYFHDHPWVEPQLKFALSGGRIPFSCIQTLSKTTLPYVMMHLPRRWDFNKAELEYILAHELNHALTHRINLIWRGANQKGEISLKQYLENYLYLISQLLTTSENDIFNELMHAWLEKRPPKDDDPLSQIFAFVQLIKEKLANFLIDPTTSSTCLNFCELIELPNLQKQALVSAGDPIIKVGANTKSNLDEISYVIAQRLKKRLRYDPEQKLFILQ